MPEPDITQPGPSRFRRLKRWVGYPLAGALLIASIVYAIQGGDWSRLAEADLRLVLVLVAMVGVNMMLTATLFWLVTHPFEVGKRVGFWDMQALVISAALLNYLPLRPGLFARIAYVRKRYDISVKAQAVIHLLIGLISTASFGVFFTATLLQPDLGLTWGLLIGLSLLGISLLGAPFLRPLLPPLKEAGPGLGPQRDAALRALGWLGLRSLDMLATTGRLMLAFSLFGYPIGIGPAILLASSGMFITLVGITPNGLGLREWAYGLIAVGLRHDPDALKVVLAVGLIDRAAEILLTVPTGLVSLVFLHRRGFVENPAPADLEQEPDQLHS